MKNKGILTIVLSCLLCILVGVCIVFIPKQQTVYAASSESDFRVSGSTIIQYVGTANSSVVVTIPDAINGTTITAIGGSTFSGRTLGGVVLSSNIVKIQDSAFRNVRLSQTLDLMNVTEIGADSFSNSDIRNITGRNVQTIGNYAFYNARFSNASFDSVTKIGSYAFMMAGSLDGNGRLTLGPRLNSVGTRIFQENYLDEIFVSGTGNYFSTYNNSLIYNKNNGEIIGIAFGTGNKSIYIQHPSIKSISSYVCFNAHFAEMTILNQSNTFTINSYAFAGVVANTITLSGLNIQMTNNAFCDANITNLIINTKLSILSSPVFSNAVIDCLEFTSSNNVPTNTFTSCSIRTIVFNGVLGLSSNSFGNLLGYSSYPVEAVKLTFETTDKSFYNSLDDCGLLQYTASIHIPSTVTFGIFSKPLENLGFELLLTRDNYKIYSRFKETYTITASCSTGGSISPGTTTVIKYETISFNIKAGTGYYISDVLIDGVSEERDFGAAGIFRFKAVAANHTIHVVFEKIKYQVFVSVGTGGTIDPSETTTVEYGDSLSFTISPNEGYQIKSVKVYAATSTGTHYGTATDFGTALTCTIENIKSYKKIIVIFEKIKYDVKFYSADGSELLLETQVEHGATATYTGTTPVKEGTAEYSYTFDYWVAEPNGETETTLTNITSAKKFYAHFSSEINKYTITWQNYDGSELLKEQLEYGVTPNYTGTTPTKAATAQYTYTFAGWTPAITTVVANATYKATFNETVNQYTVTFFSEDGKIKLGESTVNYGATAIYDGVTPSKVATAEYTYSFAGWVTEVGGTVKDDLNNVVANRSVYASFTATKNKYTITWQNYDGSELLKEQLEYGVTPNYTGTTPTKAATAQYTYTFAGWTPAITTVVANATYKATFNETVNQYTVTFFSEDGKTKLGESTVNYGATATYDGVTPSKVATAEYTYSFAGWVTEVGGTVKDDLNNVVANRSVYASFTATKNKYTITWQNYDGSELLKEQLEYGVTPNYTGATPTKAATAQYTYTFAGWTPAITTVVANATYKATFNETVNQYTVTFFSEDGKTKLGESTVNYGATATYDGVTPSKVATAEYTYSFAGWVTEVGGTVKDDLTNVVENRNVYASFTATKNKYTITWQNYDGSELLKEQLEYGVTPNYTGTTPTKAATAQYTYTFAGWTPAITTVVANATYKATFNETVNQYTVTFFSEDGKTKLGESTVNYGATATYGGVTPSKVATAEYTYSFAGWVTEVGGTVKDDLTNVIENRSVYASFTATKNMYTITWLNYDGKVLLTEQLEYGVTPNYTGTTPTKAATAQYTYTFAGWTPAITTVVANATYKATFNETVNQYTVTFFSEDGKTKLGESTVNYGATATYGGVTPSKAATAEYTYSFAGWVTEVGGTVKDDLNNVVANRSVYASFTATKNKYTITWQNYDGSELLKEQLEYGVTPNYTGATPTRPSDAENTYVFVGWVPEVTEVTGDATYTAVFESTTNKYTVTFYNENGTVILGTAVVDYGETATYPNSEPTKTATAEYTYLFAGWVTEVGGTVKDDLTNVIANRSVYASFTATKNMYTITWLNYDGKVLLTEQVEFGVTPNYTGATPTKPSDAENTYVFVGWVPEVTEVTGDATYTAVFESTTNKYTVTFYSEDGLEILGTDVVDYGETATYPNSEPTKTATAEYTYSFAGWVTEVGGTVKDDLTNVIANRSVYASFTATKNMYTITWQNYDGKVLLTEQVEFGVTPNYTGATPTKPSDAENTYVFVGWVPEVTEVTGDATYTAVFESTTNKYTVTFYNEKGTVILGTAVVDYGETAIYPNSEPTKPATAEYTYSFAGWVTEVGGTVKDDLTNVIANRSVYASFTATKNMYTIIWLNYDGKVLLTEQVEFGVTPNYTGATPTKPSDAENTYVFVGWVPEVTEVTGDATYTAVFESTTNKYSVTFYSEDGLEILGTDVVDYGETAIYPNSEPIKTATAEYTYSFAGWVTEVGGTVKDDLNNVVANRSVYASFTATKNKYTITWQNYDGAELLVESVEYGKIPEYTGATPTKPSDAENTYVFVGWVPEVTEVTGDATYTAVFESTTNKYTVTFYSEDGLEILGTDVVDYGETATYPNSEPTKTATAEYTYTFAGWVTEVGGTVKDDLTNVIANRSVYASFTATKNMYTITWLNYDGKILLTEQVEFGVKPSYNGQIPQRDSTAAYTYTFIGWTPEIVVAAGDATYTATYDAVLNKYTITWLNYDSDILATDILEYGELPIYDGQTPTRPAVYGVTYVFIGWTPEVINVSADATYTAQFAEETNVYVITWLNYDGSLLRTEQVMHGDLPVYVGSTPIKEGNAQYSYSFIGWNPTVVVATKDAEYVAEFVESVNKYTVTFYSSDGDMILGSSTVNYGETATYSNPLPTKDPQGQFIYVFSMWVTEKNGETEDDLSNVVADRNVYAYFIRTQVAFSINIKITGPCEISCNEDLNNIEYGASRVLTINGDLANYHISITVNGNYVELIGNSFTIYGITENINISVTMSKKSFLQTTTGSIIIIASIVGVISIFIILPLTNSIRKKNRYKKMSGN